MTGNARGEINRETLYARMRQIILGSAALTHFAQVHANPRARQVRLCGVCLLQPQAEQDCRARRLEG